MKTTKIFFRGFKRNTRLNLLNISSMAIGIAAAIIVLSYVYQEFNYDTQYPNSNRVYRILTKNDKNELSGAATYGPLAQSLKSDFPEINDATRVSFYWGYLALTTGDKKFNETRTIFADSNFFTLFSFPFVSGDASKCLRSPNSIVLSESAARKYFGETDAVGKQIKIGKDKLFTVAGVYKDFSSNSNFRGDIILPLEIMSRITQVWIEPSWNYQSDIHTFVLTENIAAADGLSGKIENYLSGHVQEKPEKLILQALKNIHTEMHTGWESVPQANRSYLILLGMVALAILTMSAVNFLMLYIGMASKDPINTSVKKVCGASKTSLFRDHVGEIFSYILISTTVSLFLVFLYNSVLTTQFSFLPKINNFSSRFLQILSGIILVYTIFTSVLPAIVVSRLKSPEIYKAEKQSLYKQPRILNILVVSQFTIGVVLLAITTLFYKQIHFLKKHNPGFAREELITIPLNMHIGDGFYNENMDVFCEEIKKQAGVKEITFAFSSPSDVQTSADEASCDGMPEGETVQIQWNSVYYDYFETLGIKIAEGRGFNRNFQSDMVDFDSDRKCAYVINQKAAKELGVENPIGKTLYSYQKGVIVGIAEDFNFKSLHSEINPMCFNMNPFYYNEIIVRINPQTTDIFNNIEKVWNDFVPAYPFEFKFVDDQLNQMYEAENNLTASLNAFSGIAILIACMGLLALTILSMQKRTKEIGIRKVNGAKVSEIVVLLNQDYIKWVTIAFIVATPIAFFVIQNWLENFAYQTSISWWIFVVAGIFALLIALLTVSFQSYKAATKNPVEALRYE
ncbi:FtsX-like permease family protein [Maribellus comscasis]|uniref:FtsX-like permease family protein n=1 Tax=Maribellus comscasis TaxID=2681766 RepID=A0A6I6JZM9_9BACT|nr:ABC transporter permease [Maribellus comscasis]QGY44643.1 FtsX-like permease family protein [Maribellus comscasis]